MLHATCHCRFVSKAEVRHWLLIGTLATGAGTLYVERESRRDAMHVVHRMVASLKTGNVIAIFPEGTTSDRIAPLPFHSSLIQAAVSSASPVQPVSLRFIEAHTRSISRAPCYVGDDTLIGSIWRTLTGPRVRAVVRFGLPQRAKGRDRRAWAADLRAEVNRLHAPAGPESQLIQ